ncbi:hypothetical protein PUND_a1124 [Pseudoalteromonas undina]|nr:hypothetical protein PUND_a1124 [Pseudoalteromonas undina]
MVYQLILALFLSFAPYSDQGFYGFYKLREKRQHLIKCQKAFN